MDGVPIKNLDISKYNIILYRQSWKRTLNDVKYNYCIYYSGINSCPFMDLHLLSHMINMINLYL